MSTTTWVVPTTRYTWWRQSPLWKSYPKSNHSTASSNREVATAQSCYSRNGQRRNRSDPIQLRQVLGFYALKKSSKRNFIRLRALCSLARRVIESMPRKRSIWKVSVRTCRSVNKDDELHERMQITVGDRGQSNSVSQICALVTSCSVIRDLDLYSRHLSTLMQYHLISITPIAGLVPGLTFVAEP